jgi:hypothetical protein
VFTLRPILDNVKNISGWRTQDRLVVFAVDDYGNVRLDSVAALGRLAAAGLDLSSRFDRLDALETREDLEALFEVLSSVSDARGRPAVFTPYALCANPDFDVMRNGSDDYHFEPLTQTFERLSTSHPVAYEGAWLLWQEGIRKGLLKPQFHGREHLNVELLKRKLRAGDKALMANLENKSMIALDEEASMPGVGFTHAFGLWEKAEVARHREIIESGLSLFEAVFGLASKTFTPPAHKLHPDLYSFVTSYGVDAIDKPLRCARRLDKNKIKREWNTTGVRRGQEHVTIVRNVVFEPTRGNTLDAVGLALDQVAAAFRWRRPAIISSHRVNFCGHIDEENRSHGLAELKRLLDGIAGRWPDAQFIGADELVEKIRASA